MKKVLLFCTVMLNTFCYGQSFDGNLGSRSLNWSENQKDFNSPPRVGIHPMSLRLWDNYDGLNAPSQFGSLLEINGREGHLTSQLYFDNTWDGGRILYRSAFYAQDTWENWRYLLDSKSDVKSSGSLKITGNENSYVSGNLGIGEVNPKNKLDVNGTIHSKEVKVDMNGWSDFVFKKDYVLPTLEEVEKHITGKGHLENIPNEEEVLKNGINLGEMNSKLLQKIEELTLYMIEQNKRTKKIEQENQDLRKEIATIKKTILD